MRTVKITLRRKKSIKNSFLLNEYVVDKKIGLSVIVNVNIGPLFVNISISNCASVQRIQTIISRPLKVLQDGYCKLYEVVQRVTKVCHLRRLTLSIFHILHV